LCTYDGPSGFIKAGKVEVSDQFKM
jgi:hypothetical protein